MKMQSWNRLSGGAFSQVQRGLLASVGLLLSTAGAEAKAPPQLDPWLLHMQGFREGRLPLDAPFAPRSVRQDTVRLLVVFEAPLSAPRLLALERLGARFERLPGGAIAHVGPVYGLTLPWSRLAQLTREPDVLTIEAAERRMRIPSMDLSMPEIDWSDQRFSPSSGTDGLSGRGVTIADFDTSVDLTHPSLFYPDGGLYAWLDVDDDGRFTPGVDGVDLNDDQKLQAGERLRMLEAYLFSRSFGPQVDGIFDADADWLYADLDQSGAREAGLDADFGETDLAYGEPLFIVEDSDMDGELDIGETLVRLGTSKVKAGLDGQSSPIYHTRGTNLLTLTPDPYPHGTPVAGILVGDWHGRRYAGVAPEADLLAIQYDAPGIDLVSAMSWARDQGADVFLYEFGEWIGEFLDGTSALETAIKSMASSGLPQVCPAGNIGADGKHGRVMVAPSTTEEGIFQTDPTIPAPNAMYVTALWRQQNPILSLKVAFPDDTGAYNGSREVTVVPGQTTTDGAGNYVSAVSSKSTKNTNMLDLVLYRQDGGVNVRMRGGSYKVTIQNTGTSTATLHLFLGDDLYGWGGNTWIAEGDGAIRDAGYSVSSPGTGDSCITVGSYAYRTQATVGQLSTFSGRGPRIDETALLDVAAPGNFDVYSPVSTDAEYLNQEIGQFVSYAPGGYFQFGGTSAASAHAAGVAALLRQASPTMTHASAEAAIRAGATADTLTGTVPNNSWGMGRLKAGGALKSADQTGPTFQAVATRSPLMRGWVQITIIPSERLAGVPAVTGVTGAGAVMDTGTDLYQLVAPAPSSGQSLTLTLSGVDLAGNSGQSQVTVSLLD